MDNEAVRTSTVICSIFLLLEVSPTPLVPDSNHNEYSRIFAPPNNSNSSLLPLQEGSTTSSFTTDNNSSWESEEEYENFLDESQVSRIPPEKIIAHPNNASLKELEEEGRLSANASDMVDSDTSWTIVEEEYVNNFKEIGENNEARWEAVRILDNYKKEVLSYICRAAYLQSHHSNPLSSVVMSYGLIFSELIIGRGFERHFSIDVLKCEKLGSGIFHLTKGRSADSVYFVKNVETSTDLSNKFTLDQRFRSDIILKFRFTKLAETVYSELRPRARLSPENDSASPDD